MPAIAASGTQMGDTVNVTKHRVSADTPSWLETLIFRTGATSDSTASLVTSIVTASLSNITVTGTYALETIPPYSSLRQSITTTVTTNITYSGVAGAETAVAVVLAGGVSWYLAGKRISCFLAVSIHGVCV
jgi:hypothetical protein